MTTPTLYCSACGKDELVDKNWREILITKWGELRISAPRDMKMGWTDCDFAYACGQHSALILVERYLQSGTFERPQAGKVDR